jgi:adenosylhomocysteine nucleosidase
MELAAIARICALNQVPCLSIKCISDTFDGDGGDFQQNVTRSAQKAFEVIHRLLQVL